MSAVMQRVEKIGEKTTEVFLGRDDHLVYRSIRYGDLPAATPEGDGRCGLLTNTSSSCIVRYSDLLAAWPKANAGQALFVGVV